MYKRQCADRHPRVIKVGGWRWPSGDNSCEIVSRFTVYTYTVVGTGISQDLTNEKVANFCCSFVFVFVTRELSVSKQSGINSVTLQLRRIYILCENCDDVRRRTCLLTRIDYGIFIEP